LGFIWPELSLVRTEINSVFAQGLELVSAAVLVSKAEEMKRAVFVFEPKCRFLSGAFDSQTI